MNFLLGSRVKELQAMLFPIHPIHGGRLTCLEGLQELHIQQFGRLDPLRRETEEVSGFTVHPAGVRHHETGEIVQALLDVRCVIDGITQEPARWPTECQVISERVQHIEYNPAIPEPFYLATGKEPRPRPIGDEFGTVIFRYCPTTVTNYFNRSCVGGTPVLPYSLEQPTEKCVKEPGDGENNNNNRVLLITESNEESNDLRFESRFESGNLCKVVKITDTYYQLYLRKDLYTQRHTQWYYFRISNTRSRTTYRLSIVNLCKEESLYNEGLRPLLYSSEDAKKRAVGWRRCGDNIAYYRNDSSSDQEKERHTLTFNVSFPYDRDTVYLAHCYPYTYSDLQEYLAKIVADPMKTRFTKLRLLCRTLAGNRVYYLTITAPAYEEEVRRKKGVVITARVHPGETPSSWTMKGIIDFLTGESNQAKELRERFVFKLVPMLNPDGVIVGNNRCSLSGKDLNRQYKTVMRESYPSIWQTKLMIRRLLEECGVAIYCDLHAHSRKHNIFAYGCESKRNGCYAKLSEQVFPLMLHKNAADKFSFENCKFHVEKGKEGAGRVVVWSMGIQHSYTLEASMGGSKIGSRAGTHFSPQDYEQIGRAFCETLLDFFDQDPVKEKLRMKIIARLTKEGSTAEEPTNIDLTDYSSDEGDASDSTVSEKEEEFTDTEWSWRERNLADSPQHLSVPPPSPVFGSPASSEPFKRRSKNSIMPGKGYSYAQRKKLLARKAVIDLPTTDPGSDVYDYNSENSAGEDLIKSTDSSDKQEERQAKGKNYGTECLRLPKIVRPRSVSFVENLIVCDEPCKKTNRPYCRRFTRTLRNTSPVSLKSQDIQIKLSSLRRQIWTGVATNGEDDIEAQIDTFAKRPLSWGLSSFVSTYCNADNLLKSCSKKLESLDKMRKTCFKREHVAGEIATQTEDIVRGNDEKSVKKKRSRLKWQRAIGLSSRINHACNGKSSFLTIKAETLKLVSAPPLKQPLRSQRPDTRRKYRKNGIQTMPGIGKSSLTRVKTDAQLFSQTQPRLFLPPSQSFSSDEESSDSQKQRTTKKKSKKKKQQQKKLKTPQATRKKRAISSGKILSKIRESIK